MWTAMITQPGIACVVQAVARFCKNPGLVHKKAVLKVVQYVLQTKEWEITCGRQGCRLNIKANTDSYFGLGARYRMR